MVLITALFICFIIRGRLKVIIPQVKGSKRFAVHAADADTMMQIYVTDLNTDKGKLGKERIADLFEFFSEKICKKSIIITTNKWTKGIFSFDQVTKSVRARIIRHMEHNM